MLQRGLSMAATLCSERSPLRDLPEALPQLLPVFIQLTHTVSTLLKLPPFPFHSQHPFLLFLLGFQFSSVQSLSCVRLLVTPWIIARQASLSITNSLSSLRLTSIESVHLILCRPLLLLPQDRTLQNTYIYKASEKRGQRTQVWVPIKFQVVLHFFSLKSHNILIVKYLLTVDVSTNRYFY